MFLIRIFKTLIFCTLLVFVCVGQATASSRVYGEKPFLTNSTAPLSWKLKSSPYNIQKTLSSTNSFSGSASVPDSVVFTNTGIMNFPRSWHAAVLLKSGKVLVAGGFSNGFYLATAEIYDPVLGTWNATGSMNVARSTFNAILLNDGKVLVAGGYPGGSSYIASAELYDPDTGTWSLTGSMSIERGLHTMTLLNDGQVLVTGGDNGITPYASAELYDPVTGTWSATGSMSNGRVAHTATLLNNGKVLVAGGANDGYSVASAELYDPSTGTWSPIGSMNIARSGHSATLLSNGDVLVVQGYSGPWQESAELYNPSSGTWSITNNLYVKRFGATTNLLNNGKVMVAGGSYNTTELYDPSTGTWNSTSGLNIARWNHSGTLLNNNQVLLAGGEDGSSPPSLASAELATLVPAHTFTGTLTLPSGWTNGTFTAEFVGATNTLPINAGALSNDGYTWGSWVDAMSNVPATITWNISEEGESRPVYLRLRDINGQEETVVQGTVNIDLTAPKSSMTQLPSFVGSTNVPLSWFSTDDLSGVSTFDLQARAETDTQWTDILTDTTETNYTFHGIEGTTYYFRVRAKDIAGNVEEWREPYDTSTVGTDYGMTINNGALFTNSTNVILTIAAKPATSQMQIANDGGFAGTSWEDYTSHKSWQIISYGSYVIPRVVYVRYKDTNGNVSSTYQDDIILDVTPPTGNVNITDPVNKLAENLAGKSVTLLLSATDDLSGVGSMMVSNRADFADAGWQPYSTSATWTMDNSGIVYVRFKDYAGNVSRTYSDMNISFSVYLPLINK